MLKVLAVRDILKVHPVKKLNRIANPLKIFLCAFNFIITESRKITPCHTFLATCAFRIGDSIVI